MVAHTHSAADLDKSQWRINVRAEAIMGFVYSMAGIVGTSLISAGGLPDMTASVIGSASVAATFVGYRNWRQTAERLTGFGRAADEAIKEIVEKGDAIIARKGERGVWLVWKPNAVTPEAMSVIEFSKYEAELSVRDVPVYRIAVQKESFTVSRHLGGRLEDGDGGKPAFMQFAWDGKLKEARHFSGGLPSQASLPAQQEPQPV